MGGACAKHNLESEDSTDLRGDGRINWAVVGRSQEEREVITHAVDTAVKQKLDRRGSVQMQREAIDSLDKRRHAEEAGRALDLGRMAGLASKDVVQDKYQHGALQDATSAGGAPSSAKHGRRGSFMDTAFDRNYPIHGTEIKTAGKARLIQRRQSQGMYKPINIM